MGLNAGIQEDRGPLFLLQPFPQDSSQDIHVRPFHMKFPIIAGVGQCASFSACTGLRLYQNRQGSAQSKLGKVHTRYGQPSRQDGVDWELQQLVRLSAVGTSPGARAEPTPMHYSIIYKGKWR